MHGSREGTRDSSDDGYCRMLLDLAIIFFLRSFSSSQSYYVEVNLAFASTFSLFPFFSRQGIVNDKTLLIKSSLNHFFPYITKLLFKGIVVTSALLSYSFSFFHSSLQGGVNILLEMCVPPTHPSKSMSVYFEELNLIIAFSPFASLLFHSKLMIDSFAKRVPCVSYLPLFPSFPANYY